MRYFQRGMAAVEIAKTPEDYEKAIKEFEQAIQYALSWADAYYNLGLVQEKAERYKDAITSLKKYLELSPNAPDAIKVKELIFKLEYKAENVLSPNEIVDILVSLPEWQIVGSEDFCSELIKGFIGLNIRRVGPETIRVLESYEVDRDPQKTFMILKVPGPILRWTQIKRNWGLNPIMISMAGVEGEPHEIKIEVLSRERVIIRKKRTDNKGQVRNYLCEYVKPHKDKASKDRAKAEEVREAYLKEAEKQLFTPEYYKMIAEYRKRAKDSFQSIKKKIDEGTNNPKDYLAFAYLVCDPVAVDYILFTKYCKPQGINYYSKAIDLFLKEKTGSKDDLARAYLGRASLLKRNDQFGQAIADYTRGIEHLREFLNEYKAELISKGESELFIKTLLVVHNLVLRDALIGRANSYEAIGLYKKALPDYQELCNEWKDEGDCKSVERLK